jgi:glycosyltransferase involved in cell wall biosynthesis
VIAPAARECSEDFEAVTPYVYPLSRLFPDEDCWDDFLRYLLKRHHVGTIVNVGCDFLYAVLPEIASEFPEIRIFDQLFNDDVHYATNRHYAAYLDGTFVPSQMLANKLITEGGERAEKVSIIAHGVAIREPAPASFEGSGLPADFRGKFLVSFFGRLSIEKAPADFVEIAHLLRENGGIRFLMTGEGKERASVLALIERYGLQDRIYAPGFVDNAQDLMALSDVVVVPSTLDGMPLVVFEAQALGKPVVASAVGSIPDVVQDGKTGLLCRPGDVRGFADRILQLWKSPELRRAIAAAGGVAVRANHGAESMTDKYLEVFEGPRQRGSDSTAIGYNRA